MDERVRRFLLANPDPRSYERRWLSFCENLEDVGADNVDHSLLDPPVANVRIPGGVVHSATWNTLAHEGPGWFTTCHARFSQEPTETTEPVSCARCLSSRYEEFDKLGTKAAEQATLMWRLRKEGLISNQQAGLLPVPPEDA